MSPTEMRAAQVMEKDGEYILNTVPIPEPKPGQMVIQVKAAGFCHTDNMVAAGIFNSPMPITGSHEPAGIVVKLAPDVEAKGEFKVGDHVIALNQVIQCGKCYDCKHLDPAFCPNGTLAGLHSDGAFSEYFCTLAAMSAKIPEDMPWDQAAPLTCAGVTIFEAIQKAGLKPGEVLGISGLGALGHIGVQMAKAMGLIVVGIDAREPPIELCRSLELAPDLLINAAKTSAVEAKKQLTALLAEKYPGKERLEGVDAILTTAEVAPALSFALDMVRRHGTFVLVSQPKVLTIPFTDLIFKNVKIVGTLQGNQQALRDTVALVQKAGIKVKTTCWDLDHVNEMRAAQHAPGGVGKNVVIF